MGMDARTVTYLNIREIAEWCEGVVVEEFDPFDDEVRWPALNVPCGDEVKRASIKDIVMEVNGVFDVIKNGNLEKNQTETR